MVAGILTGAGSIDDMDVLRSGGMASLSGGVYAPSTLGEFLRAFHHGNVRQLQAAAREFLVQLARGRALLPGADAVAFLDVDSLLRRVYGKQKQGAGFGHAKVGGRCPRRGRGRGNRGPAVKYSRNCTISASRPASTSEPTATPPPAP